MEVHPGHAGVGMEVIFLKISISLKSTVGNLTGNAKVSQDPWTPSVQGVCRSDQKMTWTLIS